MAETERVAFAIWRAWVRRARIGSSDFERRWKKLPQKTREEFMIEAEAAIECLTHG